MTSRKRIGPYEIISELGRGSFASVFLAKRVGLELPVALKVVTRLSSAEERARFEREAQVTSALEHPGIVGCFDIGTDEKRGWLYLALEYAPGGTLEQRLRQAPLLIGQALDICAQVADALAYAHGKGVLHRDIKPENVLFDAGERPRLADFGLAFCASSPRLTADGETLGTPLTMAPEQFQGKTVDERTDVYGLGVTLYFALTGDYPYPGKTGAQVRERVLRGRAPPPSHKRAEISPGIDSVCLRAMAVDPSERFQTMQGLARALRANLEESRTFVAPRRRSGLAAGLIAAAAVLLLTATAMVVSVVSRDHERPRTEDTSRSPLEGSAPAAPTHPEGGGVQPPSSDRAPEPIARAVNPTVVHCLQKIQDWSFAAAEDALSQARGEATQQRELREAEQQLSAARSDELRACREQNDLYEQRLRPADALAGVERLLARHPGSSRLRKLRIKLLGARGRYADVLAEYQEIARRDPDLLSDAKFTQNQQFFRMLAGGAERAGPAGPTPFAEWIPIHGGRWASEGSGVVRGSLYGMGEFGLAGLIHRSAGRIAPPYRVSVELELDCSRENAFGGLLFGVQDTNNFLLAYVLHDMRSLVSPSGESVEEVRRRLGGYPKALRVARVQSGHWQLINQLQVRFGDSGWVELSVDVTRSGLQPTVDGETLPRLPVADALDGRVGILKFYDNVVGFRAFSVEPR